MCIYSMSHNSICVFLYNSISKQFKTVLKFIQETTPEQAYYLYMYKNMQASTSVNTSFWNYCKLREPAYKFLLDVQARSQNVALKYKGTPLATRSPIPSKMAIDFHFHTCIHVSYNTNQLQCQLKSQQIYHV